MVCRRRPTWHLYHRRRQTIDAVDAHRAVALTPEFQFLTSAKAAPLIKASVWSSLAKK